MSSSTKGEKGDPVKDELGKVSTELKVRPGAGGGFLPPCLVLVLQHRSDFDPSVSVSLFTLFKQAFKFSLNYLTSLKNALQNGSTGTGTFSKSSVLRPKKCNCTRNSSLLGPGDQLRAEPL